MNVKSALFATDAIKPSASRGSWRLDADEAIVRKEGERLIVEPVNRRPNIATLLAGWEPLDESLPDADEGLLPLDDIRLW